MVYVIVEVFYDCGDFDYYLVYWCVVYCVYCVGIGEGEEFD